MVVSTEAKAHDCEKLLNEERYVSSCCTSRVFRDVNIFGSSPVCACRKSDLLASCAVTLPAP